MRTLTVVSVLAVSLAACQPADEAQAPADAPDAAQDAASAAADASNPADTVEAQVREGLWQTVMTADGNTVTSRACMSAATNPVPTSGQASAGDCEQSMARTGDGWTFSSRCALPTGGETRTEGTMTGDLQTAYRVEATTTTSGAPIAALNRTSEITTEATYQGACPEGWRPGDVEVAGMRMNLGDMQRQAEEMAGR
ncbi:DUF3617 family protein [Brevundimonas sp.]|uniref:DUF3617 domain-containing protein n=1 Tax=Brevundimonas sp. TaxID=1871086 RepID=UPI0025EB5C0C|nr:DUF3617 family protein [Brevundimonas sp.]